MLEAWHDFFVAVAGAAAALAGLLFVAISINLSRILQYPDLPARGLEALTQLIGIMLVALFGLVPEQPAIVLGLELAVTGLIMWTLHAYVVVRYRKQSQHRKLLRAIINQLPSPPLVVAGILFARHDAAAAYWIVPAVVLSFNAGVIGAWVMLVEIQR